MTFKAACLGATALALVLGACTPAATTRSANTYFSTHSGGHDAVAPTAPGGGGGDTSGGGGDTSGGGGDTSGGGGDTSGGGDGDTSGGGGGGGGSNGCTASGGKPKNC
jgi:hypothetical protein